MSDQGEQTPERPRRVIGSKFGAMTAVAALMAAQPQPETLEIRASPVPRIPDFGGYSREPVIGRKRRPKRDRRRDMAKASRKRNRR